MSFSKYIMMAGLASFMVVAMPTRGHARDTTQQAAAPSSLETRIETILNKDADLATHDIDVEVAGGVVTLKGTVRTAAEKARAERLAKIEGVTRIDNEITVDPNAAAKSKADRAAEKTKAGTNKAIDATKNAAEKTADKTKEIAGKTAQKTKEIAGATKDKSKEVGEKTADKSKEIAGATKDKSKEVGEKTAEKSKEIAGKTADKSKDVAKTTAEKSKQGAGVAKDAGKDVGQKTKEAASTTGEAFTDGWITTKVKAKFIDEDALKGSDINVDTNNHVVTLKGTVATAAGKARAEEIARTTDGVNRVVNQLVVKQ